MRSIQYVIDLDNASMYTSENQTHVLSSFNYFLLDWLGVETTDRFAVMAALGYYSAGDFHAAPRYVFVYVYGMRLRVWVYVYVYVNVYACICTGWF